MNSHSKPSGYEALDYIVKMLKELHDIADSAERHSVSHFIEMALLEAEETKRSLETKNSSVLKN